MKIKFILQFCAMLLSGIVPAEGVFAQQWPVYLEGTATTRNVVFESFLRKT